MAKHTCQLQGTMQQFCRFLKDELIRSSFSASLEEEDYYQIHDVNVGTLVFERYSYTGKNRLSLTINVAEYQNHIRVTAISSGGSQGMFFKINTFGEDAFLEKFINAVKKFKA